MANHFPKLLACLLVLISTGCGPFFVKPGTPKSEPPPAREVTASSRREAVAAITKSLREKPEVRVFKAPGNHGWIEEYQLIKVEDMGVKTVLVGKKQYPVNQMSCRITSQVTRWKTYNDKKKGEPSVRQVVTTKNYSF